MDGVLSRHEETSSCSCIGSCSVPGLRSMRGGVPSPYSLRQHFIESQCTNSSWLRRTIIGPGSSVVGQFATWGDTAGSVLADFDLFGSNNVWTGTNTFNNTLSGTGFTSLFASPPAVGGTAAAAGKFTTLQATGNLTTNITGSTQCLHVNSSGVVSGFGADCPTAANISLGNVTVYWNGSQWVYQKPDGTIITAASNTCQIQEAITYAFAANYGVIVYGQGLANPCAMTAQTISVRLGLATPSIAIVVLGTLLTRARMVLPLIPNNQLRGSCLERQSTTPALALLLR